MRIFYFMAIVGLILAGSSFDSSASFTQTQGLSKASPSGIYFVGKVPAKPVGPHP
ncbi:MAG: hypothetical protein K2P93_05620 [Alphaproteobacteria bacterium]|nr:hypothetical protein [Alphaproteobacteria bacterium]